MDAELDRSYISLLERQVYQPSLETIFKIAKVLEVPAHEIIKKVEEMLEKE